MTYPTFLALSVRGLTLGGLLLASATATAAGDITQGQAKAVSCVACHGADGLGKAAHYPNLQGQHAAYLEKQLKAFRDGSRHDPSMSAMARPLSDQDIADLSAFFAALK